MKRFYQWVSNEKYRSFDAIPKKTSSILKPFIDNSLPVIDLWRPFSFQFEENKKRISDFPYLAPAFPVVSEKALFFLRPLIGPHVEILPLNVEGSDFVFYGLNVLTVYDLDLRRCDYSEITSSDPEIPPFVPFVYVQAFQNDVLPESPIFRIKHTQYLYIYISEEIKGIIELNKLTGLLFDEELKYRTGDEPGRII